MRTWVKLYTETNRDPKIGTLTWAQRGIWAALLALAGELDDQDEGQPTGMIGTVEDIAWRIRCGVDELTEALTLFEKRDMAYREYVGLTPHTEPGDLHIWYITHFQQRQERPPSEQPAAVTERVKRHRERAATSAKTLQNPVTDCNESVTACNALRFRIDTDTDADADADSVSDALDGLRVGSGVFLDGLHGEGNKPPTAEPVAVPTHVRRRGREFPERTQIYVSKVRAAYPEDKKLWPNTAQVESIEKVVSDPLLFARVVDFWVGRGYNPRNVIGMLEMYLEGGPKGNGGNRQKSDEPAGYAGIREFMKEQGLDGGL